MDLSGMIFVALAVVWAVYLIPRAVNRSEDELALAPPEEIDEVVESSVASGASRRSGGTVPTASATDPSQSTDRQLTGAERVAVRLAVARRRRVLVTLAATTGLVAVASLVSPLPLWSAAVPAGLVVAWLVVCRVQVRRLEAARAARPLPASAPAVDDAGSTAGTSTADTSSAAPVVPEVSRGPVVREPRVEVPVAPVALVVEPDEDTVGLTEADREAARGEVMPHGAVWDPRPLTLPTYISKPRARRVPRTMALDPAGVSSSGRDARDSRLVAEGAAAGVDATARPREAVGS